MKVAIVRQRYVAYGGAERFVARFVDELIRRGHEVHIFTHRWISEQEGLPGVVFHRVFLLPGGSFFRLVSFAVFSHLAIRKENFDIVHSFERIFTQDIYRAGDGCHREWLNQRRKMLSVWGRIRIWLNPFHWATLLMERHIYTSRRTGMIIANSNRGKEEMIRHYQTPPEKIEVVYNGVDLQRFHPENCGRYRDKIRRQWGIDDKDFMLLFAGSGFERKGLAVLIQAAGMLRRHYLSSPFKVVIAGHGNRERYLKLAKEEGIAGDLLFIGAQGNMEQIYAAGDIFVFPTLYDPFANVCLEAMASGLAVITTRINGISELMTGPLASLVIEEACDVKRIADLMFQLSDPLFRAQTGRQSREAAERFPEEGQFEKIFSLYTRVRKERTNIPPPCDERSFV